MYVYCNATKVKGRPLPSTHLISPFVSHHHEQRAPSKLHTVLYQSANPLIDLLPHSLSESSDHTWFKGSESNAQDASQETALDRI